MQKIDALDTLQDTIDKLEYLLSSTYFMMLAQKNGDIDFKREEVMGFYGFSNEVVEELKIYRKNLSPLLFTDNK